MQKYGVNQLLIGNLLSDIQMGKIAIPEIQRPFVWDSTKVRDLLDSLYKGFPIGYIIAWNNPSVRLKDGSISSGKKILIDGQQRITALQAAILGQNVINKEYKEIRIIISFNPITEEFATLTPAIQKDTHWISDISVYLKNEDIFTIVEDYLKVKEDEFNNVIQKCTKEQAIKKIFTTIKHCHFIVFQSKKDVTFFQFGIRQKGFFLDYPVTNHFGNKKNFERTLTFFQYHGFQQTEPNSWEYKKYFIKKLEKMSLLDVYFKRDIKLINECINYLLLEVYKDDLRNYRIILG